MEQKGMIFDIKKFAVHDGPGIRSTVFFKGCPLRCSWCQNPEGISFDPQVMLFEQRCLDGCRDCIVVCPQKALSKDAANIVLDRGRCDGCGLCAASCPADALQMAGKAVSVEAVINELAKDEVFYLESGGGITCSGGEPLTQIDFLHVLLQAAKKRGWHTAVDTSGHAPFAYFAKIIPSVDLFLFDLKSMDADKHRRHCGEDNGLIVDNLRRLSEAARSLSIRVPLVPGFNDSPADLDRMADFCQSLPRRHPLHLLPYHRGGSSKCKRLGLTDPRPETMPPNAAQVKKALEIFRRKNIATTYGG
ncbi:MAG: glycyl-radical enzyme activating protein [Candidatus Aminicenantes bacterium]|nr:glycyl-radical enzyme activating protein [Candidatus Aminicenantes bacterium]